MINNTKIVVITPVRNEAWILKAYLTATSLWADEIIIADQMSTDGSRDIYKLFPKVTVIDNMLPEMNQSATRRLLFDEVKKIKEDVILFALDADEFLSGDFLYSNDWRKIIESKKDDCFEWRWMNLCANRKKYTTHIPYFWALHVSDDLWNGPYSDTAIHEWRLPWSPNADESHQYSVTDFYSIHFARVNVIRQKNKERFYQVSSVGDKRYNFVNIYHQYHSDENLAVYDVPENIYATYEKAGIDVVSMIDFEDEGKYYTDEVIKNFNKYGIEKFAWLDIWDESWCKRNNIKKPQKWYHKLFLKYMNFSNKHRNVFTRGIDKLLKLCI